jgi:hypothetical protein
MPLNEKDDLGGNIDPIMGDTIDSGNQIVVSTGYMLDINALIHWHNGRDYRGALGETDTSKWLMNPMNNSVFSERDIAHIRACCDEKGISIESLKLAGQQPVQAAPIPVPPQQHHAFFQPPQPAQAVWTEHYFGAPNFEIYDSGAEVNRLLYFRNAHPHHIQQIEIHGYTDNTFDIIVTAGPGRDQRGFAIPTIEHNAQLIQALNQHGINANLPGIRRFPNTQNIYHNVFHIRGPIDAIRQIVDQVLASVESLEGAGPSFQTARQAITGALQAIQAAPQAPHLGA